MPTISAFYGIIIRMFFDEHAPPYFHAQYAEFKAAIDIKTLEVIDGKLPRRALELVLDWAELHQAELMIDWDLCQQQQSPTKSIHYAEVGECITTWLKQRFSIIWFFPCVLPTG